MKSKRFLLAILICIAGCKPADDNEYFPVEENIKKDFYYQPGTYWIYVDSITNQESKLRIDNAGQYISVNVVNDKSIQIEYLSSSGWWLHPNGSNFDSSALTFELMRDGVYAKYGLPSNPISRIAYPLIFSQDIVDTISSTRKYYGMIPQMQVLGQQYTDIHHVRLTYQHPSFPNPYDDEYWITRKDGIIKAHLRHPSDNNLDRVYELKSYNINR